MHSPVVLLTPPQRRRQALGLAAGVGAFLFLETAARMAGDSWDAEGTALRLAVTAGALALAALVPPKQVAPRRWHLRWLAIAIGAGTLVAWIACALTESTVSAWLGLAGLVASSLWLAEILVDGRRNLLAWLTRWAVGAAAVASVVIVDQIASHYADEEFFAALDVAQLVVWWILLDLAAYGLRRMPREAPARGLVLNTQWARLVVSLFTVVGLAIAVRTYQLSFYPVQAPSYPGISETVPFVCGPATSEPPSYDGLNVHRDLLAAVEANPRKASPEFGMLALGTGETRWAEAFRSSLMQEVALGLYTAPASSVKSVQHEAALRAYYYPRVAAAFPGLFKAEDGAYLHDWFAEINRRALTVEWVDWLYGLAFSKWPEGPYENQENGAGLLAVLQAGGLQAPELADANELYLRREPRGWSARFRVTDDALIYQPEWITNAYFQSQVLGSDGQANLANSFEWLLMQAVPDGAALGYNHPGVPSLAGTYYLGAILLDDPRFVWLAGRALEALRANGGYVTAQPGAETGVDIAGQVPRAKSCLLYGDSGLPTQVGPLAPDKVVLRSGWEVDSLYLLLNLRFSGWHRYKATGTLTMLYRGQPLVVEENLAEPSSWLPTGRSLFRDKRIPRENLNGLVIERRGLSRVLSIVTGRGGRWAQDPPYYDQVTRFEPGQDRDLAEIALFPWHGWQHTRTIMIYDEGIVVVVDEAAGPKDSQAAIVWHLPEGAHREGNRIVIREGENAASLFLLTPGEIAVDEEGPIVDVSISSTAGQANSVSLFLTGPWAGAEASLSPDGREVTIMGPAARSIVVPLG